MRSIGEIGLADLNILDCIWVNANPYDGPWTGYGDATRLDQLVASTDPVAADIWAVTKILIPAFLDNGYTPPWPYPAADPGRPLERVPGLPRQLHGPHPRCRLRRHQ